MELLCRFYRKVWEYGLAYQAVIDTTFELACGYLIVTIEFKDKHYPKDVILYAVFFYVRYAV